MLPSKERYLNGIRIVLAGIKIHFDLMLELGKVRITSFVAVSTSVGYLLYTGRLEWRMIFPVFAVFLLASGSSSLNHFQERNLDSMMDRTKGRPIPSGRATPFYAVTVSIVLALMGSVLLLFSANLISMLLGLLALIWYNAVYTPLKKRYALAVVPGSVIGAIPPVIGWVAAGGAPTDMKIISLALFFFIWQIPHFWLLLLLYSKDYEKAGFPTLTRIFSNGQLGRITYVWMAALAASCMLIPVFNFSYSIVSVVVMLLLGVWLMIDSRKILSGYLEKMSFRRAFVRINLYVLAVVIILSIDKLFL